MKKSIPKTMVRRLITSSSPLSLECWNKFSLPPVIIWPASLALLPWSKTIAIKSIDIISKIFSNIFSLPFP